MPRVVVMPTGLEARVQHPADKMAIVISYRAAESEALFGSSSSLRFCGMLVPQRQVLIDSCRYDTQLADRQTDRQTDRQSRPI